MDFEDLRTFVDVPSWRGVIGAGALASRSPSSADDCFGWKLNSASSFSHGDPRAALTEAASRSREHASSLRRNRHRA